MDTLASSLKMPSANKWQKALPPSHQSTQNSTQKIAATGKRAKEEAEQKDLKQLNKIFCGVEQGMQDEILKAVDNDYLLKIEN